MSVLLYITRVQYGVLCKIRFIEVVYKLILHASKKSYCMKLTNEDVLQVFTTPVFTMRLLIMVLTWVYRIQRLLHNVRGRKANFCISL